MNKILKTTFIRWFPVISFIIITITLIYRFFTGFRSPSSYVVSQLIITYDHGFISRGFIGAIIKLLLNNGLYNYKALCFIIISVGVLFILWIIYNAYLAYIKKRNFMMATLLFWFSLSLYPAYLAHTMGYFEQYAYIFAIVFVEISLLARWKTALITGGIFSLVSVLISETNAFLVCPIFIAITLMVMYQDIDKMTFVIRHDKFKAIIRRLFLFFLAYLPSGIYLLIIRSIKIPQAQFSQLMQDVELNAPAIHYFERRFDIIGFFEQRSDLLSGFSAGIYPIPIQMLLFTLLIVYVSFLYLSLNQNKKTAVIYLVLATFVNISCYSMAFFWWDIFRWYWSMSIATLLLSIYFFRCYDIKVAYKINFLDIFILGTIAVLSINAYHIPLFDKAEYNFFLQDFIHSFLFR